PSHSANSPLQSWLASPMPAAFGTINWISKLKAINGNVSLAIRPSLTALGGLQLSVGVGEHHADKLGGLARRDLDLGDEAALINALRRVDVRPSIDAVGLLGRAPRERTTLVHALQHAV